MIAYVVHEHKYESEAPAAGITQDIRKWLDGAIRRIALTVVGTVYSGCRTRGRKNREGQGGEQSSHVFVSGQRGSEVACAAVLDHKPHLGCSRGRQARRPRPHFASG